MVHHNYHGYHFRWHYFVAWLGVGLAFGLFVTGVYWALHNLDNRTALIESAGCCVGSFLLMGMSFKRIDHLRVLQRIALSAPELLRIQRHETRRRRRRAVSGCIGLVGIMAVSGYMGYHTFHDPGYSTLEHLMIASVVVVLEVLNLYLIVEIVRGLLPKTYPYETQPYI